ncbi:MAG: hypothetical protein IT462_01305 [Planctomycetes bacterium]|nr:hypothetical protein [Planctomycetota bacterium]
MATNPNCLFVGVVMLVLVGCSKGKEDQVNQTPPSSSPRNGALVNVIDDPLVAAPNLKTLLAPPNQQSPKYAAPVIDVIAVDDQGAVHELFRATVKLSRFVKGEAGVSFMANPHAIWMLKYSDTEIQRREGDNPVHKFTYRLAEVRYRDGRMEELYHQTRTQAPSYGLLAAKDNWEECVGTGTRNESVRLELRKIRCLFILPGQVRTGSLSAIDYSTAIKSDPKDAHPTDLAFNELGSERYKAVTNDAFRIVDTLIQVGRDVSLSRTQRESVLKEIVGLYGERVVAESISSMPTFEIGNAEIIELGKALKQTRNHSALTAALGKRLETDVLGAMNLIAVESSRPMSTLLAHRGAPWAQ